MSVGIFGNSQKGAELAVERKYVFILRVTSRDWSRELGWRREFRRRNLSGLSCVLGSCS